jgi:hypothetical protein
MTLAAFLALLRMLQQAPLAQGPTIGDTIWLTRTVGIPAGAVVRPQPWNPTGDVEALGPARLLRRGDSMEVAYPAVVWRPGVHEVTVPGPLFLLEGGGVDSAPAYRSVLSVASVLPRVQGDSTAIPVQPAVTTVRRADRTTRPVALFLLGATALLAPLHWWWRRRGVALDPPRAAEGVRPPLARWADRGEGRAALAVATAELRRTIARGVPTATPALETEACVDAVRRQRPEWPVDELAAVLRALDAARFRPEPPASAAVLVADVGRMTERLEALP